MEWHPRLPPGQSFLCTYRDGKLAWVGFASEAIPNGSQIEVRGLHANALVDAMPLRFDPPSIHRATHARAYGRWWRRLQYVFPSLRDPLLFPPLGRAPTHRERVVLDRYVTTCEAIATSDVVNDAGEVAVRISGDESNTEAVETNFPRTDRVAGFAALLRQCYATEEKASFKRTYDTLWVASSRARDERTAEREAYLRAWWTAGVALRNKSVSQLVRDCFVEREGWSLFDYSEDHSPDTLLNRFNYGELIHWGKHADDIVHPNDDAFVAAIQRGDFLAASIGLAHLYIGFGELVRAALTPPSMLLTV